jgi:hypothetical protein
MKLIVNAMAAPKMFASLVECGQVDAKRNTVTVDADSECWKAISPSIPTDAITPPPPFGLGDLVAAAAKVTGAAKIAELFTRLTGKDCGCAKRREKLNRLSSRG